MKRYGKLILAVVVGLAVLIPAGTYVYIHFIEGSPPPPLTLDTAASGRATTTTAPATTPTGAAGGTSPTTTAGAAPAAGSVSGTWKPSTGSVLGYRVKEVLFGQSAEAVGRTSDISGSLAINGATVSAVDLTVNLKTVSSDRSQRDGQFQGRIMNTSQFPTATFKLTDPITLSNVPDDNSIVDAKATGDLTLRGTTNRVSFDLKAQRDGSRIKVNGSIPIVFADYKIPNPSFGPATTEDHGLLEFLVVFEKA